MRTYGLTNPLAGSGSTPEAKTERDEIRRLQIVLRSAGLYKGPVDGVFGAGTGDACKQAKWRLGYPRSAVSRTGGQILLDYLTGKKRLPLAYVVRRKARGFGLSREEKLRAGIVRWARQGVKDEPQIHYAQVRPIPSSWRLPMLTDCSGFVTLCYRQAGAKDPNGLGYNGQGWTGTLLDHGETVPLWQAKPGDLVIWGAHPGHHVAVIVDVSNPVDPLTVSHGSDRGPIVVSVVAETAAQRRPYVVKRYPL